jgi:hypothetical protein
MWQRRRPRLFFDGGVAHAIIGIPGVVRARIGIAVPRPNRRLVEPQQLVRRAGFSLRLELETCRVRSQRPIPVGDNGANHIDNSLPRIGEPVADAMSAGE